MTKRTAPARPTAAPAPLPGLGTKGPLLVWVPGCNLQSVSCMPLLFCPCRDLALRLYANLIPMRTSRHWLFHMEAESCLHPPSLEASAATSTHSQVWPLNETTYTPLSLCPLLASWVLEDVFMCDFYTCCSEQSLGNSVCCIAFAMDGLQPFS